MWCKKLVWNVEFKSQPDFPTRIFNINLVNFVQLWLEQTSGIWVMPVFFSSEEFSSSLEVLSELCNCPSRSSQPLPFKDSNFWATHNCVMDRLVERKHLEDAHSAISEGWKNSTNKEMQLDSWRAPHHNAVPCSKSALLESQDAYVTLSTNNHREQEILNNILEETMPLEIIFASGKQIAESHSDFGSMQQSSGSSRLSSQSSFEYPNYAWMSKVYTYMAAVDSGVSMDYSPMHRVEDIGKLIHTNEYKNGIDADRSAFMVKKKPVYDDGWERIKMMDYTSTEPWNRLKKRLTGNIPKATLDLKTLMPRGLVGFNFRSLVCAHLVRMYHFDVWLN